MFMNDTFINKIYTGVIVPYSHTNHLLLDFFIKLILHLLSRNSVKLWCTINIYGTWK